ncbi:MAG: methionyl-tRNA formyltransferase [Defluviitaleaceae bacterium]|nr:methionyl-tRNA formyltransferase [Defluviitaleaceae bacterium]
MKIVFFGTPEFASVVLESLLSKHDVLAAVTQPDRPSGRGNKLKSPPVKEFAKKNKIPFYQPETLRGKKIQDMIISLRADAYVVAAYGLMLPRRLFSAPKFGTLNPHASLLPKFRGASPIQAAIKYGDTETGISVIQIAKAMDAGDIIFQKKIAIGRNERFESLQGRLALLGGECALSALEAVENGTAVFTKQDDSTATFAPAIKKEDGHIDFAAGSDLIINMARAYDPWPAPHAYLNGEPIRFWEFERIELDASDASRSPGTILCADVKKGLAIKTGDGALKAVSMQPSGGRRMSPEDYLRGHKVEAGLVFN